MPAQRDYLVRDGILAGFQSSRETAPVMGRTSNGCMRADGWNRIPLVRMTTVSLEPGTWDFDELIADTEGGLYIETNNSWSIDDKRLNFQFGTEIGWEIENGKLGRMVRRPQLHRHHAAVLELVRRDLLARLLAGLGSEQLRQGRTHAGRSRGARCRSRPLQGRAGRGGSLTC